MSILEDEWVSECPECGSENVYQEECDDSKCVYCGGLFNYCDNCGWTDHEECDYEEEW